MPKDLKFTRSGYRSLCIIGQDKVLKLFMSEVSFMASSTMKDYVRRSFKIHDELSQFADKIIKRGIALPCQLDFGEFSRPLIFDSHQFIAWQLLTRVPGCALSTRRKWSRQKYPRQLSTTWLPLFARIAACIHVPVEVGDNSPLLSEETRSALAALKQSGNLRRMQAQLMHDMDRISASRKEYYTLLHRDLHAMNVLKDNVSGYGVIDWDDFDFGKPERDLFLFGIMPQHLRTLCNLYNSLALRPVDIRLVTAVAYVIALTDHRFALSWPGIKKGPSYKRRELEHTKNRVLTLGCSLSTMTGKPIYSDFAKVFVR